VRIISYTFILLIIIFGVSFAALNSTPVIVNYYFDESAQPLSLVLVLTFSSGCIVGMIVGCWLLIKAKLLNYRIHQRLILAEKEIENLRAIPLQDKV
jgi:putative membrane protein